MKFHVSREVELKDLSDDELIYLRQRFIEAAARDEAELLETKEGTKEYERTNQRKTNNTERRDALAEEAAARVKRSRN